MRQFSAKQKIAFIAFSLVLTRYFRNSIDILKRNYPKEASVESKIPIPLSKQYPIAFDGKFVRKVVLSIGIICLPTTHHIEHVRDALQSITTKLNNHKNITYKIYIAIFSQNEHEEIIIRNAFEGSHGVQFLTVSMNAHRVRMRNPDISLMYHKYHHSFLTRQSHINMLAAMLCWYASQESQYFLFLDHSNRANANFVKEIERSFDIFRSKENIFFVRVSNRPGMDAIYRSKYLVAFSNYLHYMSPYNSFEGLLNMFRFFSVWYQADEVKALESYPEHFPIAKLQQRNPPAVHATNLFALDPYFTSNPYEHGKLFWAQSPKKDSEIAIKFIKPVAIKSLKIITGTDVYLRDEITRAVLEESSEYKAGSCGEFKLLSDFRAGVIDMKLHRTSEQTSTCLRIRFLEPEEHWVAIQLIEVLV